MLNQYQVAFIAIDCAIAGRRLGRNNAAKVRNENKMNLNFIRNKNCAEHAEEESDIYSMDTKIINPKPSVKKLTKGFLVCSVCGRDISMKELIPLSLASCPHCSSLGFVPMKVKDFWLYEPVGGGGMGSVYRAFIEYKANIEVAVKILPRKMKGHRPAERALMKEGKIGFLIGGHPHIAKVIDFGVDENDEHFVAMEYVEGIRLDRVIASPAPRSNREVLMWALQILSAEQHIFERGYLFRDLKPQNIIITMDGNVRLVDYGLAIKLEDAMNNASERIAGSPHYLPPERIWGESEYVYSEIYSLGMVLYHVLARKTYYSATEVKQLINKHANSLRLNDVSCRFRAGFDPGLANILNKMIDRSPSKRYQSYKAAARDLLKIYQACA